MDILPSDILSLQRIVASDSRSRCVSKLCRPEFWGEALQLFMRAPRILIVTGFFIRKAGACETDGPPGAAVLGRALQRVGKEVFLITDRRNYPCLRACSRSIGGPLAVHVDTPGRIPMNVGLLVYIERPGHAADGCYYNMRGDNVGDVVAPLDRAAETAMERGVPVFGIGDGGNEAGMGLLNEPLARMMPDYASCLSTVSANLCLPVDISNWGAYALAGLLSRFYRKWIGLEENEESLMLEALLESGAVDGVTGKPGMSVDGVPSGELEEVVRKIKNWYFGSP